MGQVTPWRYSSFGNGSTECATRAVSPLVSRFLFDHPFRSPSNASIFSSTFDICYTKRISFRTCFLHANVVSCDCWTNRTNCRFGGFDDSGVSVRVRRGHGGGRTDWGEYRAVCRVSGNVSCLAGRVVAYRECIVCWSGR